MKIKPYFKTTLSEPYQGKYYHETGASVVMNMLVNTKSIGDFLVIIPDPVSLNFNNAQNFIDKCEALKKTINKSKKSMIFSDVFKDESSLVGLAIEKIKEIDPNVKIYRDLDSNKVFEYMQSSMGVFISLVTAVESFLNMIIPYDYIIEKENKNGEKQIFDKDQIVRQFSIEDKIELVVNIKRKSDIKQQKFWQSFKEIKKIRNEVIHFKKTEKKIDELWSPIIVSFFDLDLYKVFDDTVELINFIEPSYLELM